MRHFELTSDAFEFCQVQTSAAEAARPCRLRLPGTAPLRCRGTPRRTVHSIAGRSLLGGSRRPEDRPPLWHCGAGLSSSGRSRALLLRSARWRLSPAQASARPAGGRRVRHAGGGGRGVKPEVSIISRGQNSNELNDDNNLKQF